MIHLGHLKMEGRVEAPGFFTLVVGNLEVDGIVDLHNPYDKGFDERGLVVVLDDVTCNAFFNEYGKCSFVDGKLAARDLLVNAFGDSALVVTGDLTTNFFYGEDMWVEVGGDVSRLRRRGTRTRSAEAEARSRQLAGAPELGQDGGPLSRRFSRPFAGRETAAQGVGRGPSIL